MIEGSQDLSRAGIVYAFRVVGTHSNKLHGNLPLKRSVRSLRQVNRAHPTAPDFPDDLVWPDPSTFHRNPEIEIRKLHRLQDLIGAHSVAHLE